LSRMWYEHAPLKECCNKKQQPSHMHSRHLSRWSKPKRNVPAAVCHGA
jgi:hypothetical protein